MELFIERLPIESEKKAQKVLHVCEQRNMQEQGKLGRSLRNRVTEEHAGTG